MGPRLCAPTLRFSCPLWLGFGVVGPAPTARCCCRAAELLVGIDQGKFRDHHAPPSRDAVTKHALLDRGEHDGGGDGRALRLSPGAGLLCARPKCPGGSEWGSSQNVTGLVAKQNSLDALCDQVWAPGLMGLSFGRGLKYQTQVTYYTYPKL